MSTCVSRVVLIDTLNTTQEQEVITNNMAAEPEKHKKRGKNFEWDIKLDVLEAVMACDSGHTKPGFAKVWQTLNNDSHLFGDITDEEGVCIDKCLTNYFPQGPSVIQNIWGNSTAAKSALFQGFKVR